MNAILSILAIGLLCGCMSNRQWLSGKDVDLEGAKLILITPWGQQTIEAQHMRTRVNPKGTRTDFAPMQPLSESAFLPIHTNAVVPFSPRESILIDVEPANTVTIRKSAGVP